MKQTPLVAQLITPTVARTALVLVAGTIALGAICGEASASTFEVTTLAAGGKGSFGDAVRKAESDRDRDKIVFGETLAGAIPIGKDITFAQPIAIQGLGFGSQGPGFKKLVLKAPAQGATLRFISPRTNVVDQVYLDGVAVESLEGPRGTRRYNRPGGTRRLIIRESFLAGNQRAQTYPHERTGIYVAGRGTVAGSSKLTLKNSVVTGFGNGVALFAADALINRSVIAFNTGVAHSDSAGLYGLGGVSSLNDPFVSSSSGPPKRAETTLTQITDSTIAGNVAKESLTTTGPGPFGAGADAGDGTLLEVTNSTIAGNVAEGESSIGGGLYGGCRTNPC